MKKHIIIMSIVLAGIFSVCFGFETAEAQFWKKDKDKKAAAPAKKETPQKAQAKAKPAAPAVKAEMPAVPAVPARELTREDILGRLNDIFKNRLDIRAVITGIAEKKDEKGNLSYEYNGAKLETLDDATLFEIMKQVNNQISLKNLQNLQRTQQQLKNLQNIQQMDRTQKMLKSIESPAPKVPKTPKPYTAPKVYKAPRKY